CGDKDVGAALHRNDLATAPETHYPVVTSCNGTGPELPMDGILLARQAIYNRDLAIHAWELLFRAPRSEKAEFANGDHATSAVLLNAFNALPVADILEGKPAFVNFTRKLLDFTPPVDTHQLVV